MMVIKAQTTQASTSRRDAAPPPSPEAQPLGLEDALVMVLFPRVAWDAVVALAQELNVGPAEVMGAALRLLRARVDEEAGHVR
jgi:hypothetical protein